MKGSGKETVIIGGGLGGLVTGALLSKEGYRVTVLEKNGIIGGGGIGFIARPFEFHLESRTRTFTLRQHSSL